MAFIQIPNREWQELDGIQEPFSIRKFQGIWTYNPMSAPEGYAADLNNLSAWEYPFLVVRPGLTTFAAVSTDPIDGIGVRKEDEFLVVSNNKVQKVDKYGYVGPVLYTLQGYSFKWSFTNFKGNNEDTALYGVRGTGRPIKFDGVEVREVSFAPDGLHSIESHQNRLFGALGNVLHFSALNKDNDWDTANDAGSIVVESPKGSPITVVKSGLDQLVLLTGTSLHELYGSGPSTFRMRIVSDHVGCVSGETCVVMNGTMYWLGKDGIYRYRSGSLPDKTFSLPVQKYIDRLDAPWYSASAYAASVGRRYYLAIPLDQEGYPKTILEYDTQFDTWMVWKFEREIRYMNSREGVLYIGLDDGRILKLDPSATTDDGSPIPWMWESPPIGSGSYITMKRWYDMWLVVDLPTGSSLNVYLSPKPEGEDGWTLVRSLTASSDLQSVRVILPIDTIANANWVRVRLVGSGPCKVYELAYRERILPL